MASRGDEETCLSPVAAQAPEATLSMAPINREPVELDSTPASPEKLRLARRGSRAVAREALDAGTGLSAAEQERRAQAVLHRRADAAVLVDIPSTPQAEELETAGAAADRVEPAGSAE